MFNTNFVVSDRTDRAASNANDSNEGKLIWLVTGGLPKAETRVLHDDFAMFRKCYSLCYMKVYSSQADSHSQRPDFLPGTQPKAPWWL